MLKYITTYNSLDDSLTTWKLSIELIINTTDISAKQNTNKDYVQVNG